MAQRGSGPRHVTGRTDAEMDRLLRESIQASGLAGKPLTVASTPFTISLEATVAGMMGPPAWAKRLKRIHDLTEALHGSLTEAWRDHMRRFARKPAEFAARWRTFVTGTDLLPLNQAIRDHNEYYPIEARIPINRITGRYELPSGMEHPKRLVTVADLLLRYPADLDMARYFLERDAERAESPPGS